MKAPADDQLRLLQLQALDTKLDRLDHRERELPASKALAGIESRLANLRDDVVIAQTQLKDLARAVQRAENEVEQVRKRSQRDQELLDSGSITSSKQLEELQREIVSLTRRQNDLEDAELEVMESAEEAQNAVAALTAAIDAAQQEQKTLTGTRDEVISEISRDRRISASERAQLAGTISAELLTLYEKLRKNGGVGAAQLTGVRCDGCHMQLSPTELSAVQSAPPDEVQRCEECRRILVRVPVS